MNHKTEQELVAELAALRQRIAELETLVSDVAQQKRVQAELAKSRAILQATIECLPFDFFAIGLDGRYMAQNAASRLHWGNYVGARPEDVAGNKQTAAVWLRSNRRAFAGEKVDEEVELNFHGETRLCHNIVNPITLDGQIQGILGISIDITQRKRAELALQESEERYRQLAESTTDLIYISSRSGEITYANRSAAAWLRRAPDAIVGKRQEDLFPPEIARRHTENVTSVFESGKVFDAENVYQLGGESVWLHTCLMPLRDETGQITAVMGVSRDISARKQAEESLRKAHDELEERVAERTEELAKANKSLVLFRKLAEASGQGFGIATLNGQIVYVNPAMRRLLRDEKSDDVVGKHLASYLPEAYMHKREEEVVPQILREGHWQGETAITRPGRSLSVLQDSFLVRDEQGNAAYIATVMADITERKRAEEALRQSRDELRLIYDEMVEGCLITDIATKRFVRVNASMCEMLGYSEEELLTASIKDIHPPDALADDLRRFQAVAESQRSINEDRPVLRKDGSIFYADITGQRIVYDGRPCVLALFRDVTERRRAQEALRQSEEKYKMLVETSPDAVIVTDLAGEITFLASRRLAERYGPARIRELLGKNAFDYIVPEEHAKFQFYLKQTLEEGVARNVELEFFRIDGARYPGEVSATLLKDVVGKPVALMFVLRDITERKQAEEALRKEHATLRHLLQSSDHERQVIAYDIHDGLAQPLAGAIMHFQAYAHLKDTKPAEAAQAFDAGVALLHQGHFEARRLVGGVRPPIIDEFGVVTAVDHLVNEERRIAGATIEFRSDVAFDRLAPIMENAIYRIVQEGLANACKHSRSARVSVELLQRGDDLHITIQDWGVGFDPREVTENRFGLDGIRQRARLLGGHTLVQSTPGQGTCIIVDLPLALPQ